MSAGLLSPADISALKPPTSPLVFRCPVQQKRQYETRLGSALRSLRLTAGLTQSGIAEQTGYDRTTILTAEAGRGAASVFIQVAAHLGHRIDGRSLPPADTLSKRLAALRQRRGLSLREIATAACISPTTAAAVEGGELGHLAVIERIGAALGAGLRLVPENTAATFWSTVAVSSAHDAWTTPPDLLARLYPLLPRQQFDLDPCSPTADRRRAPVRATLHYTEADDGLSRPWSGIVYMNPPYGRGIGQWTGKARTEIETGSAQTVVGLVPARPDTRWWHADIAGHAGVVLLRGRLKFGDGTTPAPFASALILWGTDDVLRVGIRREFADAWHVS